MSLAHSVQNRLLAMLFKIIKLLQSKTLFYLILINYYDKIIKILLMVDLYASISIHC